jgi:hypothetical protein
MKMMKANTNSPLASNTLETMSFKPISLIPLLLPQQRRRRTLVLLP